MCSGLNTGFPLDEPHKETASSQCTGLSSLSVGSTGITRKFFIAWNASGIVGTVRCRGPLPLPGLGSGVDTMLDAHAGGYLLTVGGDEWPDIGLTVAPVLFIADFSADERPLSAWTFFGCFFSTGDVKRCQEDDCAEGALLVDAEVLSTKSNLNSDNVLSANFIRMTMRLMSL